MGTNYIKEIVDIVKKLSDEAKDEFYKYLGEDSGYIRHNKESILKSLFKYNDMINLSSLHLEDCELVLQDSHLKAAIFENMTVTDKIDMHYSRVGGDVNIKQLSCDGGFLADGLKIKGSASAKDWDVKGYLQRDGAKCSALYQSECEATAIFQDKNVAKDGLSQNECKSGADLYLKGCEAKGDIFMHKCNIAGNLILQGTNILGNLDLAKLKLGQSIITDSGTLDSSFNKVGG